MDFLLSVGGKIGEYLVAPIGKQFGYILFYNRNVKDLKTQVDELKNIKNGLQPRLVVAQRNGENVVDDVQRWLDQVNKTNEEAESFYKEELELKKRRCWNKSRYSASRRAKKMNQDVVLVLQQRGKELSRETIAYPPSPGRPEPPLTGGDSSESSGESITSIFKEVLEALGNDNINIIGVHGMDGVGMTRLLKNVKKSAKADNQFREVVIAVVSKQVNIRNVQGEIADRLGLKFTEETLAGRADRLYRRLMDDKKKLILLDDVCEKLDLEAIGIPFGVGEESKHCKIIVTSPSKRVCDDMNTQKNFKMQAQKEISKATFGLFGGQGGDPWDDQTHTTVRSLIIVFNENEICSLRIEYDDNGHSVWSPCHGLRCKPEHGKTEKIELIHPDEFLISVSGYYKAGRGSSYVVVQSLKFESNKRTFGPLGIERGHYFSSPSNVGKIIGFHGRSEKVLDAIGAYYEPISSPEYFPTELCGGRGGRVWDDGVFTTVRKLVIVSDFVINSICIEYDDNGRSVLSDVHGKSGRPDQTHAVELDYPGEFLISISGYIREAPKSFIVIGSLKIQTNRNVYGPFGEEKGTPFSFPASHGKMIGFHGKCGSHLDSLGAYIEPFPAPNPTSSIGPFGGRGGRSWDDGTFTTIRQLIVQFAEVINFICIEYDKDGRSAWSSYHGKKIGEPITIKLDYPGEFLVSVSGSSDLLKVKGWHLVSSLTFESNRRTYGLYGKVSENTFLLSPSTSGKIVGFHGKSGSRLDSIGAHFQSLVGKARAKHVPGDLNPLYI